MVGMRFRTTVVGWSGGDDGGGPQKENDSNWLVEKELQMNA